MEDSTYYSREIPIAQLNILQLAISMNMTKVVKYLLKEYSFIAGATRQVKRVDSRVLVCGDLSAEVLRTAVLDSEDTFYWLWENFGVLFTVRQTVADIACLLAQRKAHL